jgi:hypothetical protein
MAMCRWGAAALGVEYVLCGEGIVRYIFQ